MERRLAQRSRDVPLREIHDPAEIDPHPTAGFWLYTPQSGGGRMH